MILSTIEQSLTDSFNSMELTISWGGYAEVDQQWQHTDACSPFTRIYFIKDGEGTLRYGNTEVLMKTGYMYLIPIGLKFSYSCNSRMSQYFFHINMYKTNNSDFLRGCEQIREIYVGAEMIQKVSQCISAKSLFDVMQLKQLLYQNIILCMNGFDIERLNPQCSSFINEVIKYININLSMKLKVAKIADHFYISRNVLAKRFKEEMGVSIHNYIEDLVFYWVGRMIAEGQYSINQISEIAGFYDQFYFSKRFCLRYGESPIRYRNILLKQTLKEI